MESQSETLVRWDCLFERMNKSKPTDTSSDKRIQTSMALLSHSNRLDFLYQSLHTIDFQGSQRAASSKVMLGWNLALASTVS